MAEREKLQQQMMNLDKLSEKEQEQLLKRMEQLAATMEAQATRQVAAMQERQRKLQELGCTEIHFRLEGVGWKGHLACQAGRPVNIKGAMKFIGPW